jgi:hypothetical protein
MRIRQGFDPRLIAAVFVLALFSPSQSIRAQNVDSTAKAELIRAHTADSTAAVNRAACQIEGKDWAKKLDVQSHSFTELIFLETNPGQLSLCYENRDYGVVGDSINVAILTTAPIEWTDVRFEPCALQSASPNILQSSGTLPKNDQTKLTEDKKLTLLHFTARRCYNTSVTINFIGPKVNPTAPQRYALSQYDRYRGTVQGGVLFTKLHDETFGIRPDQAVPANHFIYDKGPAHNGPEYVATLNIYSVLRYFPALSGRRVESFHGRDPVNDNEPLDRLGAIFGAAITNPTHRFEVGASFELFYGVSVIGVMDYARVTRLADGVSTTAPFTGDASTIPTKFIWLHKPALGVSMDLKYLSGLLTGNR